MPPRASGAAGNAVAFALAAVPYLAVAGWLVGSRSWPARSDPVKSAVTG